MKKKLDTLKKFELTKNEAQTINGGSTYMCWHHSSPEVSIHNHYEAAQLRELGVTCVYIGPFINPFY